MAYYCPVQGTCSVKFTEEDVREWWHPLSYFSAYLRSQGFQHYGLHHPDGVFEWSSDLDLFGSGGNDWNAGAKALKYWASRIPLQLRNFIAHSHGGNVVILASQEIPLNNVILIGTPVRKEIEKLLPTAQIQGNRVHVHDARFDHIQFAGGLFDGRLGYKRSYETFAPKPIRGIGHSNILRKQDYHPLLVTQGILTALKEDVEVQL